jgi:hypothetical protein
MTTVVVAPARGPDLRLRDRLDPERGGEQGAGVVALRILEQLGGGPSSTTLP